jgi:hypothetical protein
MSRNYESYKRSHVMMKNNIHMKTPIMLNTLRIKQTNIDKVFNLMQQTSLKLSYE